MALHLSLFSIDTAARIQNVYFDENKSSKYKSFCESRINIESPKQCLIMIEHNINANTNDLYSISLFSFILRKQFFAQLTLKIRRGNVIWHRNCISNFIR